MDPLCPPLGLPDNESRTHRRSLRERMCDILYVHAIEQVASRDRRGQGAYHIEARELSRTSAAYAYDARQPAAKGGHGVTRFGMWRIPDGSAQNCGSCWSGLHPASGRVGRRLEAGMRSLVDMRMRLTGQNGVSDYDLGFTNFLYTFETSAVARADAAVRRRTPRTRRLG